MTEVIQNTGEVRLLPAPRQVVRKVSSLTDDVRSEAGGRERNVGAKGIQLVERMAAGGLSDAAIAKALKMNRETFRFCRRRQPEVEEALQRGRSAEEHALFSKLHEAAMKGNVVAAIFLLKSRHGYRDQGNATDERPNIVINLPDAVSPDSYLQRIGVIIDGGDLVSDR